MDIPFYAVRHGISVCLRRSQPGFSLVEIMIVLAIVSILGITALPSLQTMVHRNRVASEVNHFLSQLHLARSEAIKQGTRIVICQSPDAQTCARTSGWEQGWIIFKDNNLNRQHDDGELLLRTDRALSSTIRISTGASLHSRRTIVYQATGLAPGSTATFTFCSPGAPDLARAIILSNTGRPRLSATRADGSTIKCSV